MLIFNLIGFNIVWFSLVYWGNLAIPLALAFLIVHIYLNKSIATSELLLVCSVTAIGVLVDSILQYLGVFIFIEQSHLPFWLIVLWLCFATTISHSLNILSHSRILQFLAGMLCAPLSYIAGKEFHAVEFGMTNLQTYCLLSGIWGLLMLSFFYIKELLKETEVSYEESRY